jgi:hypothetical protein
MKHIIPTLLGIWLSSISFSAETKPFPHENLRLWLKADAGITTEDNSKEGGSKNDVAQWTDQSGEGIELTPAYKSPITRPSLVKKVSEIGGKPALQFSGKGGSRFEITDALIGHFKKSFDLNRGTVFLVASMPFIPTISPLTLSATADSKTGRGGLGIRRGGKSDSWFCVHYGGPGNGKKIQSHESKLDTKFHILTVSFDKHKSELEMIVDGKKTGTKLRDKSTLPLEPIRFVQIGGHGILDSPGDPGAEWFFNGKIAEIIVFDRILGNDPKTGSFAAVGNYLQRKYGISGNFSGTDSK